MKVPPHRFEANALVYLRANPETAGVITGFLVRPNCPVAYLVTWGNDCEERAHWETELLDEKPL